ncbi:MAG: hypothetical protein KC731_29395 [Myxococcales bacterium]|nr:hypothetical protein [Myxococcales bacterium]
MKIGGWFGFLSMVVLAASLAGACGDNQAEPCQDGEFRCEGQELQRCVSGAFEQEEICPEGSMCMADHGHCHPGEEGGHSHEGGGHEGGAGGAGGHAHGGAGGHAHGGAGGG